MRKVHYRVVLDVFTVEDDDTNGVEEIESMDFLPDNDSCLDIQDVTVESVQITDSR